MARRTRVARAEILKLGQGDPRRGIAMIVGRAVAMASSADGLGDIKVVVHNSIEQGIEVEVVNLGQRGVGLS